MDETRVHSTSIFVLIRLSRSQICICPGRRRCDRKVRGNTPSHLRVRILWSDARVSLGAVFAARSLLRLVSDGDRVLGPGPGLARGSIGLPRAPRRSDTDSCGTAAHAEPLGALARRTFPGRSSSTSSCCQELADSIAEPTQVPRPGTPGCAGTWKLET